MTGIQKILYGITARWFALLLVFILGVRYGRQALLWLLTKLYDLFIMKDPFEIR